jgi:phosphoribosylformylglycinamidine cyclo-ligase
VVDRAKIIDGKTIRPGDAIIGLPSSGLHTNGFSLAREILFNQLGCRLEARTGGLRAPLGEELLRTHVLYLPLIRKVRTEIKIKGIAHITGGGLMDNIPRILPDDVDAEIQLGTWTVLPLFQLLASAAKIKNEELHQVFNMGIGMVFIVAAKDVEKTLKLTKGKLIGKIVKGRKQVILKEEASSSAKK